MDEPCRVRAHGPCLDFKFPYFNSNYSLAVGKLIAFKFKSLTMSKMEEINRKRVLLHTEE